MCLSKRHLAGQSLRLTCANNPQQLRLLKWELKLQIELSLSHSSYRIMHRFQQNIWDTALLVQVKEIIPIHFCSHSENCSVDTFQRCCMYFSLFIWLYSILLSEFLVIILTVDLPWHWSISRKTINLTRI